MRILIDSLPTFLRNSRALFKLCKIALNIPETFYSFRQMYDCGLITLSELYSPGSRYYSRRISPETDINSKHINHIRKILVNVRPKTFMDVGCGSGYLINYLNSQLAWKCTFTGIDYDPPKNTININYIKGSLHTCLEKFEDKSIEMVTCTHTLEHIEKPSKVIDELLRISKHLILVVPLEKKFKWGLNYHINFYPTKELFLIENIKTDLNVDVFECLGDLLVYIYR